MLNPPDLSRGHAPLGGLYLTNPDLNLTPEGARASLNMLGCPVPSLSSVKSTLNGYAQTGVMLKEAGSFRLAVTPAEFRSRRERHRENEASNRHRHPARTHTHTPAPRATRDPGLPTQQQLIHRARMEKAGAVCGELLAHIYAHPDTAHDEVSLQREFREHELRPSITILRSALLMLSEDGTVRHWAPTSNRQCTVYYAIPPARPNLKMTFRHTQLLNALKTRRRMSMSDVRAALDITPVHRYTPAQAREASENLALDLYHLHLARLRTVGASYVLHIMDAPAQESA